LQNTPSCSTCPAVKCNAPIPTLCPPSPSSGSLHVTIPSSPFLQLRRGGDIPGWHSAPIQSRRTPSTGPLGRGRADSNNYPRIDLRLERKCQLWDVYD
jgi:hypothetical protein